jgi:hypothetical protein
VPGFPQQAQPSDTPTATNEVPANEGYYYVFSEPAGGSANDIEAQWNTSFVGTSPYSSTTTLQVLIYTGTPLGSTGSLSTSLPPGGSVANGRGGGPVGTNGAVNTILTTSAGNGTAQTYTVYFWNGSTDPVMTAPPGSESTEEGAQVEYFQANSNSCSS